MITNLTLLVVLILVLILVLCFYFIIRNNKVYYFCISLTNILFNELERILNTYKNDDELHEDEVNYNYIREKVEILLNKHSYTRYLLSFKSLKLKNWFTEEDLEFMKYLRQYRK